MFWTNESVNSFIQDHPIDTGGASKEYSIELTEKEDGDEWIEARLSLWSSANKVQVRSVLKFAYEASISEKVQVYADAGEIIVQFYTHWCGDA